VGGGKNRKGGGTIAWVWGGGGPWERGGLDGLICRFGEKHEREQEEKDDNEPFSLKRRGNFDFDAEGRTRRKENSGGGGEGCWGTQPEVGAERSTPKHPLGERKSAKGVELISFYLFFNC